MIDTKDMTGFELFTQLHADKIRGYVPLSLNEYIDYATAQKVDPQSGEKVFSHYFQMIRDFARYGCK